MSTISDLIQSCMDGEPVAIGDHFSALIVPKVAERVDGIVPDTASSIFSASTEE